MLIINKPRLPPIHLNRPTAAFEPDSAAPRLVLRLQWACFGGLVGRLGLLMIGKSRTEKWACPMSVSVHRSFFVALTSFQLNSRAKHRYLGRDNCVKTRLFWPTASLAAGLTADCAAVTVCSKCVMPTLKIPQIPENLLVILFIDTCLTWHVMKLGKLLFGIKFVCFYKLEIS